MAASVLCQPFSNAINDSLSNGIFPDDAKISMVLPLNKGTSKNNDIKVFKNGLSKICGIQPLKNLKWYGLLSHFKFFKGCLKYSNFRPVSILITFSKIYGSY